MTIKAVKKKVPTPSAFPPPSTDPVKVERFNGVVIYRSPESVKKT